VKITFLTAGTGTYHCGACLRDNVLAKALRAAGHDVLLLPMYLPLLLDDELIEGSARLPVFFGGINVFLLHKFGWFRHAPGWLDAALDRPGLLARVARRSHLTSARDHGELALAMLRVEQGRLRKELGKLIGWLRCDRPDVLVLSTVLQAGLIRELKRELGVRVIACFQGEDGFLDQLPDRFRADCWGELAVRVREADALVAPSRFYADLMGGRLGGGLAIEVIPNGIDVAVYQPGVPAGGPPVIGFLARLIREKGLEVMVDAFIHLRGELGHPDARLHLAGALTAGDAGLVRALRGKLARAGLAGAVEWSPNIGRAEKLAMLQSLSLFSVPAVYQEAFGLYLVEALACGVPVVQPAAAAFPELLGDTGAGLLVPAGDPVALARAWGGLLADPSRRREMSENGRRAALGLYGAGTMCDRFAGLARQVCAAV
jgi:glycosyltransferase involved in cell wall biosynthesis